MANKNFQAYLDRNRKLRKKAARRAKRKRLVAQKQNKKERDRFKAIVADLSAQLTEDSEPIPPDTEVIDERLGTENADPRFKGRRAFGMLNTSGRASYLTTGTMLGTTGAGLAESPISNYSKITGERAKAIRRGLITA